MPIPYITHQPTNTKIAPAILSVDSVRWWYTVVHT